VGGLFGHAEGRQNAQARGKCLLAQAGVGHAYLVFNSSLETSQKWYIYMKPSSLKPLFWLGSSKKDLLALPVAVRKFFGHALDTAQHGEQNEAAKVLKGVLAVQAYWKL